MLCSLYSLPTGILRLPWLRFFRAFSSVVRQMPVYNSQRRGTARTLPSWLIVLFCALFVSIVLFYVLFMSIVLFYVLFVCKCVLYYCHRVSTQFQLKISYHIKSYHISYHIKSYIKSYISYQIISYIISYQIIYQIISYIVSYQIVH